MQYNLLICSDTHETVPTAHPQSPDPDPICWLHAGDFYLNKDIASTDDDAGAEYADTIGALEGGEAYQWFKGNKLPIYAVRGNHDGHDAWGFFHSVHDVTGKVMHLQPKLLLAGLGWHGRNYNDLPNDAAFAGISAAISRAVNKERQPGDMLILLSHYPAFAPPAVDNADDSFESLRTLAQTIRPDVIIQGHIHQWFSSQYEVDLPKAKRGAAEHVLVINPGSGGGLLSIDTSKGSVKYT